MNKLIVLIVVPLMLLTLVGCTTKAQVVKDVWLDGKGGLVVQYATISHSDFIIHPLGKIREGGATTKTFYIGEYQDKGALAQTSKK